MQTKKIQEKIKEFVGDYWIQIIAMIGFIPIVARMFLSRLFYPLTIMLAAVPVEEHLLSPIGRKLNLGQVSMRIISFSMMGVLTVLSWHFGELIIILTAFALVMEGSHLLYCIMKRREQMLEEEFARA